ncbi:MAG: hypothetical protein OXH38_11075 [Chloroflexi bacterium]|nr:hypothetical protein [Chloroflexota bacterium]
MADTDLTQAEADYLIALDKYAEDQRAWPYPIGGGKLSIPLRSEDWRETFLLDLRRARIDLFKRTHQTRARKVYPLVRLDIGSNRHRNPDGEWIGPIHIHHYREGYGDKWAEEVPVGVFRDLADPILTLDDFMRYCNIVDPPIFQASGMP